MSTRRRRPSARHRPAAPEPLAAAGLPSRRWPLAVRLAPYGVLAVALAAYLVASDVPDAPWVAAGSFLWFAVLAESYRAAVPRLGHLAALAAVAAGSGVVGGLFGLVGWACPSGACTTSEVGSAIMSGSLVPVTLWMLFAPPVLVVRAVRRVTPARSRWMRWVRSGARSAPRTRLNGGKVAGAPAASTRRRASKATTIPIDDDPAGQGSVGQKDRRDRRR